MRRPEVSREHREIFEQPGAFERAAGAAAYYPTAFARFAFDKTLNSTSYAFKAINDAWNSDQNAEEIKNRSFAPIASFAETAPTGIKDLIEEKFIEIKGKLTKDQIEKIFSHKQWLDAFRGSNLYSEAEKPFNPSEGVLGLLQSVSIKRRQELFYQYVTLLVPGEVMDKHTDVFGEALPEKSGAPGEMERAIGEKKQTIAVKNKDRIADVLGGILGVDTIPKEKNGKENPAFIIARDSLLIRFFQDGRKVDPETGEAYPIAPEQQFDAKGNLINANGGKPRLMQEVEQAMLRTPRARSMDEFINAIPDSPLKGAFKLGALDRNDYPKLEDLFARRGADVSMAKLKAQQMFEQYGGVQRREIQKQAETVVDIFQQQSGFMKLAIILGGITLLSQSKFARRAGGTLAVLYLTQKFLLKQENPEEIWSGIAQGIAGKSMKVMKPVGDYLGVKIDPRMTPKELHSRTDIMQQFLRQNTRENLDTSIAGFSLLGDMSLQELRGYLRVGDGSLGQRAVLNTGDDNFRRSASQRMRELDIKSQAVQSFFNDGEPIELSPSLQGQIGKKTINKRALDVGDALATVYYLVAAERPEFRQDVELIERARGDYGVGGYSYLAEAGDDKDLTRRSTRVSDLPDSYKNPSNGATFNPRERYQQLILEGMNLAPAMTLAEFVAKSMRLEEDRKVFAEREKEKERQEQVQKKEDAKKRTGESTLSHLPAAVMDVSRDYADYIKKELIPALPYLPGSTLDVIKDAGKYVVKMSTKAGSQAVEFVYTTFEEAIVQMEKFYVTWIKGELVPIIKNFPAAVIDVSAKGKKWVVKVSQRIGVGAQEAWKNFGEFEWESYELAEKKWYELYGVEGNDYQKFVENETFIKNKTHNQRNAGLNVCMLQKDEVIIGQFAKLPIQKDGVFTTKESDHLLRKTVKEFVRANAEDLISEWRNLAMNQRTPDITAKTFLRLHYTPGNDFVEYQRKLDVSPTGKSSVYEIVRLSNDEIQNAYDAWAQDDAGKRGEDPLRYLGKEKDTFTGTGGSVNAINNPETRTEPVPGTGGTVHP